MTFQDMLSLLAAGIRWRVEPSPRSSHTPQEYLFGDGDGFYAWGITNGSRRGGCGVTSEYQRATARLIEALLASAPGASGTIWCVRLDLAARHPSYQYGPSLMHVRRDNATGELVFERDG
ncbi:hypothetical protein [Nonomuraea guangzhouensis]|uniref:Uncharacterized protein n=1 Tax=Nonomuraea guangzhouensis TaxID=1291555 RepID=A0ABW4GS43_9ACTN|nr:hypothetical protein [Nonomuraea guangzhouensis]